MSEQHITPNAADSTATVTTVAPSSDQGILAKMTAMRETTQRNQLRASEEATPGESAEANADTPVDPSEPKITSADDANIDNYDLDEPQEDTEQSEEPVSAVKESESNNDELIDFIEFAETNPNAKFKFTRNGKEMVIDAKRAAAILGQGGAIHEDARQLKIQRAEFDEYLTEQRAQQAGLTLAMEFTVQPQLQQAYDEIIKTQGYQSTFQQQLATTQDPAQQARIQASMQQNERYIQQQSQMINQLKPNIDEFKRVRGQQVAQVLETNRKAFTDKELRNEYVYNELREKLAKTWRQSSDEIIPGIRNIDLISSDETLFGLVRDGLKYRDRPSTRQAGNSIAALTGRRGQSTNTKGEQDSINKLREQAKGGDKKAADNLLMAQLSKLRASRNGR